MWQAGQWKKCWIWVSFTHPGSLAAAYPMTMTFLDLSWHVANNGNPSAGNATQSCGFVHVGLFMSDCSLRLFIALAIPSPPPVIPVIKAMEVWGHFSKAFYIRKPEICPSFLYFINIKAICVAQFQTVIVINVWKLHTSFMESVFPSWLYCDALWSEQRLTFCLLQLNRLSPLTLTSIFLSCLSVRPSDLKGSSTHPAPSFQFLCI